MTRKSKPRRACAMCKWHKYIGNSKHAIKPSVARKIQPGDRRER